jgi:hypothetical protein
MKQFHDACAAGLRRPGRLLFLLVVAGTACASSNSTSRSAVSTATAATAAPPAAAAPATSAAPAAPDTADSARSGAIAAAAPRGAGGVDTPPDSVLIGLLRRGGSVLLVRHAATDWGQRDADAINFADRAAQRNLSAVGRAQSDSIGRAVKALGLNVGPVLASPMWRCRDTAEIAFGRADTTIHLFVKSKASRDVRVGWLSTPLPGDSLMVLVSHQDPYIPLFGFQRDQLKEGDALLILPLGNFEWKILAQISPADWARLAVRYGGP